MAENLLILLNGRASAVLEANGLDLADFEVIKLDEKLLASPGYIVKLMKSGNYKSVYFGCIELQLQRFHIFMKLYLFLSMIMKGGIIDEKGDKNLYSTGRLFFVELPKLIFEVGASFFAVIYYYIKYPVTKWLYLKNR